MAFQITQKKISNLTVANASRDSPALQSYAILLMYYRSIWKSQNFWRTALDTAMATCM